MSIYRRLANSTPHLATRLHDAIQYLPRPRREVVVLAYHGADGIRQARRLNHRAAGASTCGVGSRVCVAGPGWIDRHAVGRDQRCGGDM